MTSWKYTTMQSFQDALNANGPGSGLSDSAYISERNAWGAYTAQINPATITSQTFTDFINAGKPQFWQGDFQFPMGAKQIDLPKLAVYGAGAGIVLLILLR